MSEITLLDTPCREFQGPRDHRGDGKKGRARLHRWVWAQIHGPIPAGQVVMHRCDNPPCFRYDHLRIGTQADNNRDRAEKGRNGPPREQRGEQNAMAKLSDADVTVIRDELALAEPWDGTQVRLAERFNVSKSCITDIKKGRRRS